MIYFYSLLVAVYHNTLLYIMFHIASTRFNNDTLSQNMAYRQKTGELAIYGTGFQINVKYSIGSVLFVIEMNNDENRIEGIGIITNNIVFDNKH